MITSEERARRGADVGRMTAAMRVAIAHGPPAPVRPKLPSSLTHQGVDWPLTILAALSFLFHFGVVGATFSDWLDPVVDDTGGAAVRLVETSAPSAPAVVETAGTAGEVVQPTAAHSAPVARPSRRASDTSRAASLAREADAMKLSILGTFTGGPAVEAALTRSDVPIPDLTQVARDPRGAVATGGEVTTSGGAPTVPGAKLGDLVNGHGGEMRSGHEHEVSGPRVDVAISLPEPPPGTTDYGPIIARLRPSFRSCYVHKGLDLDPSMEGKVTIDIAVAPNGDVASVSKVSGAGLSAAVEACIMQRTQSASFPAPGGRGAHARVPIVFRRQP